MSPSSDDIESKELEALRKALDPSPKDYRGFYEDTSEYGKDNDRFIRYAKQFVVGANAVETAETGEYELKVDDLYIVWFSKTLQNWKALISTSIPDDGLYFEVTHNGDKEETYVDIYKKSANHVFNHHNY